MRFSGIFQFSSFLGHFLLLLELKIKFIKFYTKFRIAAQEISTAKLPVFFQKLKENSAPPKC